MRAYSVAPPSLEQCSMMSSKTQSAATRSGSAAVGCSMACTIGSSCAWKSGSSGEPYTLKSEPRHSTSVEIRFSSRMASASRSSSSSSSPSSSPAAFERSSRRSITSTTSSLTTSNDCCSSSGVSFAASHSSP